MAVPSIETLINCPCDGCGYPLSLRRGIKVITELRGWQGYWAFCGNCHPLPDGPILSAIGHRRRLWEIRKDNLARFGTWRGVRR